MDGGPALARAGGEGGRGERKPAPPLPPPKGMGCPDRKQGTGGRALSGLCFVERSCGPQGKRMAGRGAGAGAGALGKAAAAGAALGSHPGTCSSSCGVASWVYRRCMPRRGTGTRVVLCNHSYVLHDFNSFPSQGHHEAQPV